MQFDWTDKEAFSLNGSSDLLIYLDLFLPITHITHSILFVTAISSASNPRENHYQLSAYQMGMYVNSELVSRLILILTIIVLWLKSFESQ